jgi:hypothetical protein
MKSFVDNNLVSANMDLNRGEIAACRLKPLVAFAKKPYRAFQLG